MENEKLKVRTFNIDSRLKTQDSEEGFSLLEVIVALAVMGIGLVVIMELFSGALRSGGLSKDYTNAFIYARGKMDEVLIEPKEGSDTGEFKNGYRWQSEVTLLETKDEGLKVEQRWHTYKIKVNVLFPSIGGEKRIGLVTIKAIPAER
jgi:general secretion pathway protein I